jgi:hypothetical protein
MQRRMPVKNIRGQAALEFLMTYGWAILVVLIVIGALAYFGVLNPTIMLPEKCILQMGLYCKNHIIQTPPTDGNGRNDSVFLELENGMGKGIIIREINITGDRVDCGLSAFQADSNYNDNFNGNPGIHIQQGKTRIVAIYQNRTANGVSSGAGVPWMNCSIGSVIGKTKADINIKWHFDDATPTFTHTMSGEILANVES